MSEYTLLNLLYQVGVFISRSSVNLWRLKTVVQLQMPAVLQCVNALVLSTALVYNYLPSFYIIAAIAVWEGLLGGMIYVNVFYMVSERFSGRTKEFMLGATSQAYGASITMAAVAGIFLQPWLQDREYAQSCILELVPPSNMTMAM